MTISELRQRLSDRLITTREEADESHKIAQNSYGAGYDSGYWKALSDVLNTINGEEEDII